MHKAILSALNELERMQMKENARRRVQALESDVKLLVKRCKESETCINVWGEQELTRKGYNVPQVRETINRVKNFCKEHGYSY